MKASKKPSNVVIPELPPDEWRLGIAYLSISQRLRTILDHYGIVDFNQIYELGFDLLRLQGMGRTTFEECRSLVVEQSSYYKDWPNSVDVVYRYANRAPLDAREQRPDKTP